MGSLSFQNLSAFKDLRYLSNAAGREKVAREMAAYHIKRCAKGLLIIVAIPSIPILVAIFNNAAFAGNINPEVANIGYWYGDEDIRGVIANRLGDRVFIAPAVPNSLTLINDVAEAALSEAKAGRPALIPVNLNNNHWTAIAIRTKATGDIVVFHNDSFGSSSGDANSESGQYIEAIRRLVPNAEIIDLQVHQQNDGSSCGAFTTENLIALSLLDEANLTSDAAREVLSGITDAKAIRLLQLNSLSNLYEKIVTSQELTNSKLTKSSIETTTALAFNETANLSSVLTNRLSHLYLADNGGVSGAVISSGDDQLNYGTWVVGSIGRGLFKAQDSSKIKQNSGGTTVGVDGKIDEDTTIGVALSYNVSTLKPKTTSHSYSHGNSNSYASFSTTTNIVMASLYGSLVADEQLVLTGNIEYGKLFGKTNYKSLLTGNNNFKLNGQLFSSNISVNYYLPISSVVLVPSFAASYDEVKFAAIKQSNFSIGKSSVQKFSITPGLTLATIFEYDNFQLIPELSVSYNYSPIIKSKKLSIKNASGLILSDNKISIAKNSYNLRAGLTLMLDLIEASISYEMIKQCKYLGHEGFLKLRINI